MADDSLPTRLHVGNLSRNVTQMHLEEIFSTYGKVSHAELVVDRRVVRDTRHQPHAPGTTHRSRRHLHSHPPLFT